MIKQKIISAILLLALLFVCIPSNVYADVWPSDWQYAGEFLVYNYDFTSSSLIPLLSKSDYDENGRWKTYYKTEWGTTVEVRYMMIDPDGGFEDSNTLVYYYEIPEKFDKLSLVNKEKVFFANDLPDDCKQIQLRNGKFVSWPFNSDTLINDDLIYPYYTINGLGVNKHNVYNIFGYEETIYVIVGEDLPKYTVTFRPDNDIELGSNPCWKEYRVSNPNFSTLTATVNEYITLPACPYEKSGYEFSYWTDDVSDYNVGDKYMVPTRDVSLRAVWKASTHTHSYTTTVISPTCTEQGYTTYTCECGDSYLSDYKNALGHDFSEEYTVDIPATETSVGQKSRHCSRCDEVTDVTEIPKIVPSIDTSTIYEDVKPKSWFKSAVDYVVNNGLMNGMTADTFEPNTPMSRAMLVTVLWRLDGSPAPSDKAPFTDLKQAWYKDAVAWAYENSIVNGTSADKFSPNGNITREQMAAILYRYSDYKGYDTSVRADISSYPDAGRVHDYALAAFAWANAEGLITGTTENGTTILAPRASATRAQVATILMRFGENH